MEQHHRRAVSAAPNDIGGGKEAKRTRQGSEIHQCTIQGTQTANRFGGGKNKLDNKRAIPFFWRQYSAAVAMGRDGGMTLRYNHYIIRRYHLTRFGYDAISITNGQRMIGDVNHHRRDGYYRNPTAASMARLQRVCKKFLGRGIYQYYDEVDGRQSLRSDGVRRWGQMRLL